MADLKLGNIKPVGADNVVVESKYVKGSYVVVANIAERDSLKGEAGENIVVGSLCYCQADSTFYQYNGTDWVESLSFVGYATESYVDEEVKNELDKLAETIPSIEGLASEEFVADAIKNKVDDTTLENYYTKTEADTEFMTQTEVDSRVNEIISKASNTDTIKDLTSLVDYLDSHGTEASEMAAAITELETNKADKTEIPDLAGYATEGYVDAEVKAELEKLIIPSIDGLATEEYVDGKIKDIDAIVGDLDITYTNEMPTLEAIGGIKKGQTFKNVSIQDMLTMILYKYIEISVGSISTDPSSTTCTLPNLPTLNSVSIAVTKNSATNLSFELWDTTANAKVGSTLTEKNISNNTLTFTNLNYSFNTNRTFTIKYSYNGDGGVNSGTKTKNVGTFTIVFKNPELSTPTSNLSASNSTLNYNVGEAKSLSEISTTITKNSAKKIKKLEVLSGSTVLGVLENPSNDSCKITLTNAETLNPTETTTYNYKVRVYFDKYDGEDTITEANATVDSSNLKITFTFVKPWLKLTGPSTSSRSKLEPLAISTKNLKVSFAENSDKITKVKLFKGNSTTAEEEIDTSDYSKATYNDVTESREFAKSYTNICSNVTFTAKAYNGNTEVSLNSNSSSTSLSYKFIAPWCYGWVENSESFATVDADLLNTLTNKYTTSQSTVSLSAPATYKKLLFAVPKGSYSSAKDDSNAENILLFEKNSSGNYNKTITFADGSTETYQIFILADNEGTKATANLKFS